MRLWARLERLGRWLLPVEHPAEAIYGTVLAGGVMAAYSDPPVHIDEVVVGVVVTALVYWIAHGYAEGVAPGAGQGTALSWRRLLSTLHAKRPLAQASVLPSIVLVAAALLGANPELALGIAVWFSVLLLATFGVVAGRRDGLTGVSLMLAGLLAGTLGLIIVALKSWVD